MRFLAANALTSNLESSFALGHNYHLYLNPKTNKFVFLPGDLEFSLANFLLMGSADQLMDLSLTHPYPGENKLVERLLAIKEVSDKYRQLLKDLSEKSFTKDQLVKEIEAIEKLTKEPLAKEKKAAEARKEGQGGFGPPGGAGPQAARPEDVCREAHRIGRGAARQQEQGLRPRGLQLWTTAGRRWRSSRRRSAESAHR